MPPKRKRKQAPDRTEVFDTFDKSYEVKQVPLQERIEWFLDPKIFKVTPQTADHTARWMASKLFHSRENVEMSKLHYTTVTSEGPCLPFYLETIDYWNKAFIYLTGVAEDAKTRETLSVTLCVQDFRPYFFIRLKDLNSNRTKWLQEFRDYCGKCKPRAIKYREYALSKAWVDIESVTFEYRRPAIGFSCVERKQVFLLAKVACRNEYSRIQVLNHLRKNPVLFNLFHENFTPQQQFVEEMLRIPAITKFAPERFSEFQVPHNFSVCQWLNVHNFCFLKKDDKSTPCQLESKISMADIAINTEKHHIPNARVCVFDIETLSHGLRPPDASNREDPIICISANMALKQKSKPDFAVCFSLGELEVTEMQLIEDLPLYFLCFSTEKTMLTAFVEWWKANDPDGYGTWNGETYDLPFLLERLELLNIPFQLGRLPKEDLQSNWKQIREQGSWGKPKGKGPNTKKPPSIRLTGRFSMDGFAYLPKFMPVKQKSLKKVIETVLKIKPSSSLTEEKQFKEDTEEWIRHMLLSPQQRGKLDLPYSKIGPYFVTSPLHRLAVNVYCFWDSYYTWQVLFESGCVTYINQILQLTSVDSHAAQTLGQQVLVYNKLLRPIAAGHFVLNGDDFAEMRPSSYGGGLCFPPIPGQHFGAIIADANALYPTTMEAYCISYDTLILNSEQEKTALAKGLEIIKTAEGGRTYKWVQLPNKKATIIGHHFTELIEARKHHKKLEAAATTKDDELFHKNTQTGLKKINNSTYGFCGATNVENSEGISNNKKQKHSSYYPLGGFHPIAISTTFLGRKNIKEMFDRLKVMAEAILIQGDTDSIFWKFLLRILFHMFEIYLEEWTEIQRQWVLLRDEGVSKESERYQMNLNRIKLLDRKMLTALFDLAENRIQEVSQDIPLTMEIEALTWTLHSTERKKQYCAYIYCRTADPPEILSTGEKVYIFKEMVKVRGLDCVKGDNFIFLKETMEKVIDMLVLPTKEDREFGLSGFLGQPHHPYLLERRKKMLLQIAHYLDERAYRLASGQVSLDDLAMAKTLRQGYTKSPAHAMVAKKMAARGEEPEAGDKIFILHVQETRNNQSEEWEELGEVRSRKIPIRYDWYLNVKFIPAMQRLLLLPGLFRKDNFPKIFAAAYQVLPLTMKWSRGIKEFFAPLNTSSSSPLPKKQQNQKTKKQKTKKPKTVLQK